jgi:hypothetical protein
MGNLRSVGLVIAESLVCFLGAPWSGGWLYDNFGSYFWLCVASCGIGLGAVAIALTFPPPRAIHGGTAEPERGLTARPP